MTIRQQNNPDILSVILTGDSNVAAQYVGFARKKANFLSFQSRQAGGAPLVQRFDLYDATVLVTVAGNYKKIQINGGGCPPIRMWSGLWDMRVIGAVMARPVSPVNVYPNLDSTHDYTPWGAFNTAQDVYKIVTAMPYVPQTPVATEAESFARDTTYLTKERASTAPCVHGKYLFSKQAYNCRVPSSCMTGLTRKLWQSFVGLRFGTDGGTNGKNWSNAVGVKGAGGIAVNLSPGYYAGNMWFESSAYDADSCASLVGMNLVQRRRFGLFGLGVSALCGDSTGTYFTNVRSDTFYPRTTWAHVDSKRHYSVLGKTFNRIVVTALSSTCGEFLRKKLEEDTPALTTRQKEVLESYYFGYIGVDESLPILFSKAPNISDGTPTGKLASIFCALEDITGVQTNAEIGNLFLFNWISNSYNLCHGYMGKASDDGKYMAEVWAHVDGEYELFGGPPGVYVKRSTGDVTTYEHVYKAERDPDAVVNPADTPLEQERDRWTLTATNRKAITYRYSDTSPTDLWAAIDKMRILSRPGVNWEGIAVPTDQLESESNALFTRALLGNFAASPLVTPYTFPLPSGEIPIYVIGFEAGNEYYHKLVLDLSTPLTPAIRLIRTNAETGAESELTIPPVFPMTAAYEPNPPGDPVLVQYWTPLIPKHNAECIYCLENVGTGHPSFTTGEVYRYTPKDGLTFVQADRTSPFFEATEQFDHESAYRRKFVSANADNVAADYGITLTYTIPSLDRARFVWAGHE
jgi:hypothetical protein